MNNEKGNFILLMVLAIATLLVAVVGATFAYFGATMSNEGESTTIEVTSGTLSIEYEDNSKINNGSVASGSVIAEKTFSVTGSLTGSSNLSYQLSLNVNKNDYEDGSLVYTLVSNNESNNGTVISSTTENQSIPSGTNKLIIGKGTYVGPVSSGAKHTYTLVITYVGNSNPASSIDANIVLEKFNG